MQALQSLAGKVTKLPFISPEIGGICSRDCCPLPSVRARWERYVLVVERVEGEVGGAGRRWASAAVQALQSLNGKGVWCWGEGLRKEVDGAGQAGGVGGAGRRCVLRFGGVGDDGAVMGGRRWGQRS